MSDQCRSCGAPIVWATSAKTGKAMPLDVAFKVISVERADGTVEAVRGREAHFATCPNAASHRKGSKG